MSRQENDNISRQAAIDAATYGNPQTAWQRIEALPSAQPERKKGKWLDDCGGLKCSVCGCTIDDPYYVEGYCTKCGSYNKED